VCIMHSTGMSSAPGRISISLMLLLDVLSGVMDAEFKVTADSAGRGADMML